MLRENGIHVESARRKYQAPSGNWIIHNDTSKKRFISVK